MCSRQESYCSGFKFKPNDIPEFAEQPEQPWRKHDVTTFAPVGLSDADDHSLTIEVNDGGITPAQFGNDLLCQQIMTMITRPAQ